MQCQVAVSQDSNHLQAAQVVSRSVHDAFGGKGCDLACVFFSPHFSEDLPSLLEIIHQKLSPKVLILRFEPGSELINNVLIIDI